MTDLSEFTPSLLREITPVGDDPPTIPESELVGHLIDAFWDAKLDGFMVGFSADVDGIVTHDHDPDREFPREMVALILAYAGTRIIRFRIVNTDFLFRAKAGPVEIHTQQSANVMREMLVQLQLRKDSLLQALERTDTVVLDALTTRMLSPGSYGGYVHQPAHYENL